MSGERRKRRGRARTSAEGTAFMDVAREAFVRATALDKWREVEDLRAAAGLDLRRAVEEAGRFPGRGPYASLWERRWAAEVAPPAAPDDPGERFAAIERAVGAAVDDEREARRARRDRPFEEDPEYRRFLDDAFERLARAASDGLEAP